MNEKFKIPRAEESLPILVEDRIAQLIQNRTITPGIQLPNEFDLAKKLGVSRGTLREGLRLLEEDGLIVRRPGIGTYVKDEHLIAQNPLEVNFSVTEIINSMKSKPGTAEINIRLIKADPLISKKLRIKTGSSIIFIESVRTADEKPVVYTMNIFSLGITLKKKKPKRLNRDLSKIKEAMLEKFHGSLYELLEREYDERIDYGIGKILPSVADSDLSKKLGIDTGLPLLLIEQINYNLHHKPILYDREYWIKDSFEFTIFRKRKRKFQLQ